MPEFETASAAPGERRIRGGGSRRVGQLWLIETWGSVDVERPDGTVVTLLHRNGLVAHTLDLPGTYRCGDETVTVK